MCPGQSRGQEAKRSLGLSRTFRVLLAVLVGVVIFGFAGFAILQPSDLDTYAASLAGLGTVMLALATYEANRVQLQSLALLRREHAPNIQTFLEVDRNQRPGWTGREVLVWITNVGGSPAQTVRIDVLGEPSWLKPKAGEPQLLLTGSLGVGGRVLLTTVVPGIEEVGAGYADVELMITLVGWRGPPRASRDSLRPPLSGLEHVLNPPTPRYRQSVAPHIDNRGSDP